MKKESAYSALLRDPRWQKKRLEILQRDDFICQHCFAGHKTLNVHHCFYEKGRDPWDYPEDSLVTICEDCHELEKEQFDLAIKILKLAFQKRGLLSDKILEIGRALENWDIKNNNEPRISALCFALENPEIMDFVEERMFESFRGGLKCQ